MAPYRRLLLSQRILAMLAKEDLDTNQLKERLGSTRRGISSAIHRLKVAGKVEPCGTGECRAFMYRLKH